VEKYNFNIVTTNIAHLVARSVRYLESPGRRGEEMMKGTRTLVLLHAFPLSADQWLPQLARVPPGWQFIAPDLRGFRGMGPAFEDAGLDGATMDDYAADVLALMDHLDIAKAAIAGLSMGGYVAMALVARAPKRVSHLFLADTRMTPDTDEGRAGRDAMRASVERDGPPAVADAMLPKLVGATTHREQPDLEIALRRSIEVNRTDAIAGAIGALKARPDRQATLASVRVPALIICGDEDTITPLADSEAMAAAIPGATLAIIPKAGHLSNLEQPSAFNQTLQKFLETA
jgi:pimeloyl-ACP methyl ester carboxylesterase